MFDRTKQGFTLIELLVVISIIGLLSSIVIFGVNTAREKAKDAARKEDQRQLELALRLYELENGNYPGVMGSVETSADDPQTGWDEEGALYGALVPKYMSQLPDGDGLVFSYTPVGCANDENEVCDYQIDLDEPVEEVIPPPPPGSYQCADGLDNDSDGLIDLADSDCDDEFDDDESSTVSPPEEPPIVSGDQECLDGQDNDSNGLIDFADFGCFGPNGQETNTDYGYTLFNVTGNTKIVFVSTSGNDSTGQCYGTASGCTSLSGLDLSTVKPYKDLAVAADNLRDGKADMLLLKRGDVWVNKYLRSQSGGNDRWAKSGADSANKMLIASYGSSTERPKIVNRNSATWTSVLRLPNVTQVNNLAVVGIHFEDEYHMSNPTSASVPGLDFYGNKTNILLEDLFIRGFSYGINYTNSGNGLSIRRSVIVDNFPSGSGGHSQGLYVDQNTGLTLDSNYFIHNGWRQGINTDVNELKFNHNVYISGYVYGNILFKNNFFSEAALTGVQFRSGGDMINNLFVRNPIPFFIGNAAGSAGDMKSGGIGNSSAKHNVSIESTEWVGGLGGGRGISVANVKTSSSVVIDNNIVANGLAKLWGYDVSGGNKFGPGVNNVTFTNNISYNNGAPLQFSISDGSPVFTGSNLNFTGNSFVDGNQNFTLELKGVNYVDISDKATFTNNKYFMSNKSQTDSTFYLGANSGSTNLAGWNTKPIVTNATWVTPTFSNPCRNLGTYLNGDNTCSGAYQTSNSGYDSFITQVLNNQSKFTWDDGLTACSVNNYIRAGFSKSATYEGC